LQRRGDFYEIRRSNLLDQLQGDPNITLVNSPNSAPSAISASTGCSPLRQQELRQSLLYIVNQEEMIKPTMVDRNGIPPAAVG